MAASTTVFHLARTRRVIRSLPGLIGLTIVCASVSVLVIGTELVLVRSDDPVLMAIGIVMLMVHGTVAIGVATIGAGAAGDMIRLAFGRPAQYVPRAIVPGDSAPPRPPAAARVVTIAFLFATPITPLVLHFVADVRARMRAHAPAEPEIEPELFEIDEMTTRPPARPRQPSEFGEAWDSVRNVGASRLTMTAGA